MENINIIYGFLHCLGIEDLMFLEKGTVKIDFYPAIGVILTNVFGVEARFAKDAFGDNILVAEETYLGKYEFNRTDMEKRYKGFVHRMKDAAGKRREHEMKDKEFGARIALSLINI